MEATTLVIFDYSGTLSLGAVDFGEPEVLERHLAESGLARLGIDTAARYWQEMVTPTWARASTFATGFKAIAAGCLQESIHGQTPGVITSAVAAFVDAYLRHSDIDRNWHPLLTEIQNNPGMTGVIATDHYAEATAAIQAHLAALGIRSIPATAKDIVRGSRDFIVANSADIGCLKANRKFWLALKQTRFPAPVEKVILVDDFGVNEQALSAYADRHKIKGRIAATRDAIVKAFGIAPFIIHFIAGKAPDTAITKAVRAGRKALAQ